MNIDEYQAKDILKRYGIKVTNGYLVKSVEELKKKASKFRSKTALLKAQIHGEKCGEVKRVKLIDSLESIINKGSRLLETNLIADQNGSNRRKMNKVYVEEIYDIDRELYLSMIIDKETGHIGIISSKYGSGDIEKVAKKTPEAIKITMIDPAAGLSEIEIREVNECLELNPTHIKKLRNLLNKLYTCFTEKKCVMIEINSLVVDKREDLIIQECKMNFDGNVLSRKKKVL